ncbi:MAG: glycosyltransferase family 4 protein [Anaerolineae bacterium]
MKVWIIQDGEPIPGIDENTRDWRSAILAKALVARGHEVLWWASTFDHALKRFRFETARTVELQPGLQVRLLHGPGYRHNKSPKRFWHHRTLAANYAREITHHPPPDLIFCSIPTLELAEQSVVYGRTRQVPVAVDVRDTWPDLYLNLFPTSLRGVARRLLRSEFRRAENLFQAADSIIAVSDTYLDWALRYARRNSPNDAVFPLGYSFSPAGSQAKNDEEILRWRQRLGANPDSLIVTFVGTFGSSYDLETVIRSAASIARTHSSLDIRIVIAGDGDQGTKLRQMGADIPSIVFTGWLNQSELAELMRITSVGLAAYAKDALQSLPNKPFEYMAAGLPLLSSLPGELEALITKYNIGLQYRAGDAQSLAEKIVWLAEHPSEREAMGQRSRALFEERFRADLIYPMLAVHLENVVAHAATAGTASSYSEGKI